MNWHIIVRPGVSQAIGRCGLSRQAVVRLAASLHIDLPARADRVRRRRDPDDPDFCVYYVSLYDGGALHAFEFQVDDVSAPGFLIVVRLMHFVP